MTDRRFNYVAEITAAGLTPPDDATLHFLWQIVDEGALGASRHVELSNQLILHLIETTPDPVEGVRAARLAADFIARTRGRDTPVIGNSLTRLVAGLEEIPEIDRAEALRDRVRSWNDAAADRKVRLIDGAVQHLSEVRCIMAFDYSSTVAAIVIALCERNADLRIVVPESRSIAGGVHYLEEFLAAGLRVRYILDAAIDQALDTCDAALFGIETLMSDGSFLNTIGSRMIARLAYRTRTEIYGCTDLLKLDLRSYQARRPTPLPRSYDGVLLDGISMQGLGRVDTLAPELETVPANLVTAILCEYGPMPPAAVWGLGRDVFGLKESE